MDCAGLAASFWDDLVVAIGWSTWDIVSTCYKFSMQDFSLLTGICFCIVTPLDSSI